MRTPKVSIVMPVYNGEGFVREAIDSVLAQTFKDFELIVINDGSIDGSEEVVRSYSDPRIVYVKNEVNSGLANVRNKGIGLVRGQYLAWLDCDDISLPTRLEKQVSLLDANPKIGLCGTWVRTIGLSKADIWQYPVEPEFLRARMLFDDPFATSSIMMRSACVLEQNLRFQIDHPPAEDYELWERVSREWVVTNVPEVLTYYRVHPAQTSTSNSVKQRASVWITQSRLLAQMGIAASEEEKELHLNIGAGWRFLPDLSQLEATRDWLAKLEAANETMRIFPRDAFRRVLAERWFLAAMGASINGMAALKSYWGTPLSHWVDKRHKRMVRLVWSCLRHVFR